MIVLDTHVVVWMVQADARLGAAARDRIQAEADQDGVLVPAIAIWEIAMLAERGGILPGQDAKDWIAALLALPGLVHEPLRPEIAVDCHRLPGQFHKDPADRMIAATARFHDAALITADRQILAYAAAGHLEAIDARL